MAGEGFRIPIVLDFQQSINNIQDFRRAVGRAFTDIGERTRSAAGAGQPFSTRALTGAIARQAGAAQAAVTRSPDLNPEQRQQLLNFIDRQVAAQVANLRRGGGYDDLRAPTEKEISRSRVAEERRIDAALSRQARAAERTAVAGEKIAVDTTRRASLPPTTPAFAEAFGRDRGIPSDAELEERLRLLRAQQATTPNAFTRAGREAGIERLAGLQFGLGEENDEIFAGAEAQALRLELTLARRIRELDERSDVENALIANERNLLRQTAELSVLLEQRQLAQRAERRGIAGTSLDDARAAERLARERDRARVTGLVAGATTPDVADELGRSRAADRSRRARVDSAANAEIAARRDYTKSLADAAIARRREQRAVNELANQQLRAGGQQGTPVQQLQAFIARRTGGPPRESTDYLTGRQLFASRALTTASFAASGAVLYGGVQFARELVSEATELQIQLGIVNSQLASAGDVGGRSFGEIREEIIRVSKESGVMANQVALVVRQLAGAFATPGGTPDFGRAIEEAQSAFQLGRVTGLPDQEITDSLTAISLAFERTAEDGTPIRVAFEEIGDTIIGLEQRFGVLAPEIVKFTADLAPLGAELGFTVTQLSALGAVAQQVSGRTGAVLSEQFGRILPALAERSSDLLLLFQENEKTAAQIPSLSRALAQRDLPAVLEQLVVGYESFSAAQRNSLVSLVGSRREAAAFYAILARGQQTIRALNTSPDEFTGQQAARFEDFSETVKFSFEQAQRAIEEFGIALFEAGLADLLVGAGQGLEVFFTAANAVLQPLLALNEATDGWVTKLAALSLGLLAVNKALVAMAALQRAVIASNLGQALTSGSFLGRTRGLPVTPTIPLATGGAAAVPTRVPLPFVGLTGGVVPQAGRLAAGAGLLRGFAAANAPGLILTAGIIAKGVRDEAVEELSSSIEFLREETRKALAEGVNPDEIRAQATAGESRIGFFEKAKLIFAGQNSSIKDVAEDEISKFYADLREAQLQFVLDEAGNIRVDPSKATGSQKARRAGGTPALTAGFIEEFKQNPTDLTDEAIAYLESVDDPELRRVLDEKEQEFEAGVKEAARRNRELLSAADRLGSVTGQVSLDELRTEVSSGTRSPDALIERLKSQIRDLNLLIADVRRTRDDLSPEDQAALSEQLQGFVTQRENLLDEIAGLAEQRFTRPVDLRIRIRDALNLPGGDEANFADIRSLIGQLEGLNPEEQLERVFQGIDLLRQIAEAAEEKTFTIPAEFQTILAKAQVPLAVNTAQGEQLARLLGISIDALADRIVAAITQVGLDGQRITSAIVEARRALLQRALSAAYLIENYRLRAARITSLTEQLGQLDSLEQSTADLVNGLLGGVETGGSTGYTGTKTDPKDIARAIAEANLAIRRAKANGDPIQLARLAIEAANIQARFAKDQAESLQATAARIEAVNQLRDAEADIAQALYETAQAQNANNAVASTRYAADAANRAVQDAKGTAARLRAEAQRIAANQAARDAIRDVFTSQQELLIAIANAAGDTVEAARLQLSIARQRLEALASEGGGEAEINRARAEIVSATAAVRDAQFQDQIGDIDFLLEMERISVQQAISMLERLSQIPGATEEMIRTIERRIKQLRDEVNADLSFNLPDIRLPTLYEVRRLMQSGLPEGTGGYQDNRQVQVVLQISKDVDAAPILAEVAELVGAPPTISNYPGLY